MFEPTIDLRAGDRKPLIGKLVKGDLKIRDLIFRWIEQTKDDPTLLSLLIVLGVELHFNLLLGFHRLGTQNRPIGFLRKIQIRLGHRLWFWLWFSLWFRLWFGLWFGFRFWLWFGLWFWLWFWLWLGLWFGLRFGLWLFLLFRLFRFLRLLCALVVNKLEVLFALFTFMSILDTLDTIRCALILKIMESMCIESKI